MNSKRRCTACRDYFLPEDMLNTGLSGVCSTECLYDLQDKYRAKRKRRQEHRENKRHYGRRLPGQTRDKIRERDGTCCRWCGANQNLEIHHVKYRSQGGGDTLDNLIILCNEHHMTAHSDKRRWQRVLLMVLWLTMVENVRVTVPECERIFGAML